MRPLPLSRPALVGNEAKYVAEAMQSGKLSGDGPFTKRAKQLLEEMLGAKHALLTTSCTSALELAALLLKPPVVPPPGAAAPEAILPSFTFVSTANAFLLHGYKIVFADVHEATGNLDERAVEALITPNTRAIVPVHYAGVPCEMDELRAIAARRAVAVVEDAAQAITSRYKGTPAGVLSDLACFSFHDTKNLVCGEGGALVVNREDLLLRAEIIREKGTNRSQFLMGHVDKYTWVDVGSSLLPSDILAAFLLAQLEARETIQAKRKRLWERYQDKLLPLEQKGALRRPFIPAHVTPNHHLYYIVVENLDVRTRLMQRLNKQGIGAAFHYPALHNTPMGKRIHDGRRLPATEKLGDCLLRLPLFFDMKDEDVDGVVDEVAAFF